MPNYKKLRKIGLIGSIISLLWAIFFVIAGILKRPYSHTLTEEFVKGICDSELLMILGYFGMVFLLLFIVIGGVGATENTKSPVSYAPIIVVLVCMVLLAVLDRSYRLEIQEAISLMSHEPHVEVVTLNDKYARWHKHSTRYYFEFSNGSTGMTEKSVYNSHDAGDEFYVIMCGDSCVEHFDVDQYELP